MTIPPQALQFAGSLIAILVLAWLVRRMGLGAKPKLVSDLDAIAAAAEVREGFTAIEVARDKEGRGALLRDAEGSIMLLKSHGVHVAGRILGPTAIACREGESLAVNSGERRFGTVHLAIANATSWEQAIHRLNRTGDA